MFKLLKSVWLPDPEMEVTNILILWHYIIITLYLELYHFHLGIIPLEELRVRLTKAHGKTREDVTVYVMLYYLDSSLFILLEYIKR